MKLLQKITIAIAAFASLLVLSPSLALADAQSEIQCGVNSAASGNCNTQPTGDLNDTITSIVNVLTVVVGVAAVIMIIVAGLRYVASAGNPEGAKNARNTILYAVIGLVIVAVAQLIVHFVINKTSTGTTSAKSPSAGGSVSQGVCEGGHWV